MAALVDVVPETLPDMLPDALGDLLAVELVDMLVDGEADPSSLLEAYPNHHRLRGKLAALRLDAKRPVEAKLRRNAELIHRPIERPWGLRLVHVRRDFVRVVRRRERARERRLALRIDRYGRLGRRLLLSHVRIVDRDPQSGRWLWARAVESER